MADFVNNYDPKLERCWIAEMNGENVGCVMLVKDEVPGVARLRLLLVDPKARGLKLGTRLVDECVKFARESGYQKMTLWTHSILTAARRTYEKAGLHPHLKRAAPHLGQGRHRRVLGYGVVASSSRPSASEGRDPYSAVYR